MVNAIEVYICSTCGADHEDEHESESCCPPDEKYKCSNCQIVHDTEDEAEECCRIKGE